MLRRARNLVTVVLVASALAGFIFAPLLYASTLTIPYTFSPGQVIYSSQINANFDAVRSVVNALDAANFIDGAVTTPKILDGAVTNGKLGPDAVTSSKILDGTIVGADLAAATITATQMGTGSVGTTQIIDGTIANVDIADGTIAEAKLDFASAPTTGYVAYWNGTKLDYRPVCSPIAASGFSGTNAAFWVPPGAYVTGGTTVSGSDPQTWQAPQPVTVAFLRLKFDATLAGPQSGTVTLSKNGTDTAMTCTVPNGGTACTYSATTISASAGDALTWHMTSTGATSPFNNHTFSVTACLI